jgi:mannitol/fructose-specific phosphotransferase system IIA component (Ntr-type)
MEITRKEFLDKQAILLCHHCQRRRRIMDAAEKELPENGFLDEMKNKFDDIAIRET